MHFQQFFAVNILYIWFIYNCLTYGKHHLLALHVVVAISVISYFIPMAKCKIAASSFYSY